MTYSIVSSELVLFCYFISQFYNHTEASTTWEFQDSRCVFKKLNFLKNMVTLKNIRSRCPELINNTEIYQRQQIRKSVYWQQFTIKPWSRRSSSVSAEDHLHHNHAGSYFFKYRFLGSPLYVLNSFPGICILIKSITYYKVFQKKNTFIRGTGHYFPTFSNKYTVTL